MNRVGDHLSLIIKLKRYQQRRKEEVMNIRKEWNRITAFFGKKGKAMRRIGFLVGMACIFLIFTGTAFAGSVYIRGHYRSNGTYVHPHYRSSPDRNFRNNWSTYPNINPYTGKRGTRRGYGSYYGIRSRRSW
jgi:hypothetical protein